MEDYPEIDIPDVDVEDNAESNELAATDDEEPIEKKLKRELQCPVCDNIPTTIPIPTCSMGHIVCIECKDKIPINRLTRNKPCPICRSPLEEHTSYVAGSVISLLSDIPCSFKNSGCSFEGSIEDHKAHSFACKFKMVECLVCQEECMRKDFPSHNNKECFLTSPNNTFNFPNRNSLYMIEVNTEEGLLEVLSEACYVNNAMLRMDDDGIDYVGFNFFALGSTVTLTNDMKIKMMMKSPDDPLFIIEAMTGIDAGPYWVKKMWDSDLVLAARGVDSVITFEIIN